MRGCLWPRSILHHIGSRIVATLNTSQKARVLAKDGVGTAIPNAGATVTVNPPELATITESQGWWVNAGQPGTGTVTFLAADGRSGVLSLEVVLEPLTVELGTPQPK